MGIIDKITSLFGKKPKEVLKERDMGLERVAQHEAAHGIVWYLFRDHWTVNQLTIQKENLPDPSMNGALHISPNFDVNSETNIERANELFAISLAGMIGQNLTLILQRPNILVEIMGVSHFNQILDTTGCAGDFEIAKKYLPHLGQEFKVREGSFTKYKILDLISMFQDHGRVQQIHARLSLQLLEKGTLSRAELIAFFELENFQEYIENENLDINFFHQR